MGIELQTLGKTLKAKREEMHLSLKEVENATFIRVNYLQAIEQGEIDQALSSIYALGFLRQYASFLGLDGEKIIQENSHAFHFVEKKTEFPFGLGTLERRESLGRESKASSHFLWIGISLLVLLFSWYFAKSFHVF